MGLLSNEIRAKQAKEQESTFGFNKGIGAYLANTPERLRQQDIDAGWVPKGQQPVAPQSAEPTFGQVMEDNALAQQFAAQQPFEQANEQVAAGMMSDNQAQENEGQYAIPKQEPIDIKVDKVQNEIALPFVQANPAGKQAMQVLEEVNAGDNQTDQAAVEAADKTLDDEYKAVIAGLKTPIQAAKDYEKALKDQPWYEDNKVWGAAVTFGLTMLMGGDPRTALLGAAITAGRVSKQERDKFDKLTVSDSKAFEQYYDNLNKLEGDRLSALGETIGTSREQGFKTSEREAGQGFDTREREQEQTFESKENRLSEAASLKEKMLDIRKAANKVDVKVINGLREQSVELDEQLLDLDRVQNLVNENPGAIGPIDNFTTSIGRLFDSKDYQDNRALQQYTNGKALELTQMLKGSISDKDLQKIEETLPKVSDHPSVWNDWINLTRDSTNRAKANTNKRLGGGDQTRKIFNPATGKIE